MGSASRYGSTSKTALSLAALLLAASPATASAQTALDPLLHGQLVFHGNDCGHGQRGRHPVPVEALDAACPRHDACVTDFQLPTYACDIRLAQEVTRVARDPRTPAEERQAADFTARGSAVLPRRP